MVDQNANMTEKADLPPFHLIIPAAGQSTRMGGEVPKPFMTIAGKTILRHTIEKFINFKQLQSITIAVHKDHIDTAHEAVKDLENVKIIEGSNSRKNSIYNALKSFPNVKNEEIILIHDAARMMVQCGDIATLLDTMNSVNAATLATPVTDTLCRNHDTLDRDGLWAIQTPQAFHYSLIHDAHAQFKDDNNFTDDAGLARAAGHEVKIVPASAQNIKITTQSDFNMVKALTENPYETRTASGFDVHAFETSPSDRPLMMGGIKIDHPLALTGHSDADVVLHAITDAVLGGLNEGDIGTHFPPSDAAWKDVDSALFLREAIKMLSNKNGLITFIDVTILAEAPKIGLHRAAMQARIAEIMNLPASRISIKATTTEKLGFTGRREGIACQAIATLRLPCEEG